MRVIAGTARGRPLKAPRGAAVRPTSDRVKETLFNVLMPRLAGARVLDLFAGSGGVGIEALSRGAALAVFVDQSAEHLRVVRDNLAVAGLTDGARVVRRDAFQAVRELGARGQTFDLVFVDPPYETDLGRRILAALVQAGVLAPGGWLVWERHRKTPAPEVVSPPAAAAGALTRFRELALGETVLSFYAIAAEAQPTKGRGVLTKAICPGSFDPLHNGHLDIIERAAGIFSEVVVAVPTTPSSKPPLFTVEERVAMIQAATRHLETVSVVTYAALTVQAAARLGCQVIVRGMRALTDFEYEFQLGMMNRKLVPTVETMFLMTDLNYAFISSTLVKDVARNGGSLDGLVPAAVAEQLRARYGQSPGR